MAISIFETPNSRRRTTDDQLRTEIEYTVLGSADDDAVQTLVEETAPLHRLVSGVNLTRKAIGFDAEWVDETNDDGKWDVFVIYDTLPLIAADQQSFSFDIGAGTSHITQSIKTRGIFSPKKRKAPDYHGAIGVTDDGVQGTDVIVPTFSFTETRHLTDAFVSINYVKILATTVGKINRNPFRRFTRAECLFAGAAGTRLGNELWEVTFKFLVSLSRFDFSMGSGDWTIPNISKPGWDHLWIRYEKVVEETTSGTKPKPKPPPADGGEAPPNVGDDETAVDKKKKSLKRVPIGVYIEQVYEEAEFSRLGLDVSWRA